MLTAKKKIAVRDAVPKSTVVTYWFTAREFFINNTKLLGGIGLGLLAVVIVGYLYFSGKASDELEASRQLRIIGSVYQQQQYKLAITGDPGRGVLGLQDIVKKYSNTPSGQSAALFLGNSYLYTGDFDKAYATFDDASPSSDLMASAVMTGKAAALEGKKDFVKAAELFEKAAKSYEDDFLTAQRTLDAGRAYCLAGNKEKAVELFKQLKAGKNRRFDGEMQRLTAQYQLEMD